MATLFRRSVKFTNIDEEEETRKADSRAEKLRLKKQKKEAKKKAAQNRNKDLRYFLFFLQSTRDLN